MHESHKRGVSTSHKASPFVRVSASRSDISPVTYYVASSDPLTPGGRRSPRVECPAWSGDRVHHHAFGWCALQALPVHAFSTGSAAGSVGGSRSPSVASTSPRTSPTPFIELRAEAEANLLTPTARKTKAFTTTASTWSTTPSSSLSPSPGPRSVLSPVRSASPSPRPFGTVHEERRYEDTSTATNIAPPFGYTPRGDVHARLLAKARVKAYHETHGHMGWPNKDVRPLTPAFIRIEHAWREDRVFAPKYNHKGLKNL